MVARIAPALFALLWSTGFIGARLGLPFAEPFTALTLRYLIVLAVMVPVCLNAKAPWPRGRLLVHTLVVGLLIQGVYLAGVFWAIHNGMSAGVAALIVSLQPILTALLARPMLGERPALRHWIGLGLGLAGTALVLGPKLADLPASVVASAVGAPSTLSLATILACVLSLLGITLGTVYQKRFAQGGDPRTGLTVQFAGALAVSLVLAQLTETRVITWNASFVFAILWLGLVLSVGAASLLMLLIKRNAVSSVAALFYLVPALTALMAWALFDERLVPLQIGGMVLVTVAVMLTAAPMQRRVTQPVATTALAQRAET